MEMNKDDPIDDIWEMKKLIEQKSQAHSEITAIIDGELCVIPPLNEHLLEQTSNPKQMYEKLLTKDPVAITIIKTRVHESKI